MYQIRNLNAPELNDDDRDFLKDLGVTENTSIPDFSTGYNYPVNKFHRSSETPSGEFEVVSYSRKTLDFAGKKVDIWEVTRS